MKKILSSFLLSGLTLVSACHTVLAADLPAIENFFRDPDMSAAALSPKGRYVALLMRQDDKQVLAIRDTTDLKKLTVPAVADADQKITAIHWINENRIGFTVKNLKSEFQGNLDEFAADRDGSNVKHLIAGNWRHRQTVLGSNIKDKVLTSDYAFARITHDGSDDIIVKKYSWNNIDPSPDHFRLYRLNTRTQQLVDMLDGTQPAHAMDWLLDAADVPRIVTSQDKGRCIIYYRAPGAGAWSEMDNHECHTGGFSPHFFNGTEALYVAAGYHGTDALFRYDLKTMKMDKEPLVSVAGFDLSGSAELDYASNRLMGIHLYADAATTIWFDPTMKAIQDKVNALLPQTSNKVVCPSDCLGSPVVLVTAGSDRQPTQYLLYTPANGNLIGLGGAHPAIKPAQMGLRDFYHYAARDGRQIPVYVTSPPGKVAGPLPMVVLVHGGPNMRGEHWEWESEAQFLASRGYLVIQAEYRGSTGYGYDHFHAGWKQWGQTMQDDLADAALWAVKKGWADPKRIGIMGASYGGYATLMGLIKHPDIFRCGVEWAGVTDIGLMFDTPESDASQENLGYSMPTLIGDPVKDAAMFQQNSPLLNAEKLKQPLLIAHGAQDRRVPIVHASKFRSAVSKNNGNVEWIVYPEEAHGWRHEEDNIDFWKHVEVFLDKNLKAAK